MMQQTLSLETGCEHLYPYWRQRLIDGMMDAFRFRHAVYTTGWSVGSQCVSFADHLHFCGQMEKSEYDRWKRFGERLERWEHRKEAAL